MPPSAKFTREYITEVALAVVERDGIDALTARSLGTALGSSARPIFSVFSSMDEVIASVMEKARALYCEYVERGLNSEIAFKGVGEQYIAFAAEHPKLFILLFMRERDSVPDAFAVLGEIDENADTILRSIIKAYGVSEKFARRLYLHLWIYTHGIAAAIATKTCVFGEEDISDMLTEVFSGVFGKLKSEEQRL